MPLELVSVNIIQSAAAMIRAGAPIASILDVGTVRAVAAGSEAVFSIAGNSLHSTEQFTGDGRTTEFLCKNAPTRVHVNGVKNTAWSTVGTLLVFDTPPLGLVHAFPAYTPIVDRFGVLELQVDGFFGLISLEAASGMQLALDNVSWATTLVDVSVPNTVYVKLLEDTSEFSNSLHDLHVIGMELIDMDTGILPYLAAGVLQADWSGIAGERGFEFYAE